MKWLGSGEGDAVLKFEMERGPQRTQDDASVGYVYQRPPDPEFTAFGPKQLRWALGDDSIIDNHEKWKYPVSNKVNTQTNIASYIGSSAMSGLYDMDQNKTIPQEHLVYMSNMNQIQAGMPLHHQQQYLPQSLTQLPMRQVHHQIAPAAKKLWGIEGKDAKSLALNHLNHHDGVWRDPTWAAPGDHPVSASLIGRRGGFPGGETGNILSPRGSDNGGGLGVKMVEYVLGSSPTNKDNIGLEPRMRVLHLDDKDKDKPQSPKEEVNGQPMQNGQLSEDEKCFNRTPGSRQPSPAEEELNKNGISLDPSIVIMKPQEQLPPHIAHHLPPHLAPHLGVTLAESVNQQFEHFTEQPPPAQYEQQPHQYPPPQAHQVDSAVLQQQQHNFDVQVILIMGIAGACRRDELVKMEIGDIEDKDSILIVRIPDSKTRISRVFTIVGHNEENSVDYLSICKKYIALRKHCLNNNTVQRLFLRYEKGRCMKQVVGMNTIGKTPSDIAEYLKLPEHNLYTGHCLRRTSATLLVNGGGDLIQLKKHGGWKSNNVAEGYIDDSINNKIETTKRIFSRPSTSRSVDFQYSGELMLDKSTDRPSGSGIIIKECHNCTFNFSKVNDKLNQH